MTSVSSVASTWRESVAYRNSVAALVGANGLLLFTIGVLATRFAEARLAALQLGPEQAERVAGTFYALGLSDALLSLFSFTAMIWIHRGAAAGRTLALIIGAQQILLGTGLALLSGSPFGLWFIASRGLAIAALAWLLVQPPRSSL